MVSEMEEIQEEGQERRQEELGKRNWRDVQGLEQMGMELRVEESQGKEQVERQEELGKRNLREGQGLLQMG